MKYAIVIKSSGNNFTAYVPDLPGCNVETGATVDEVKQAIEEAIKAHLKKLQDDGLEVPEPMAVVDYVETDG
jgi:predicted RNase H-like HicB family nuclease